MTRSLFMHLRGRPTVAILMLLLLAMLAVHLSLGLRFSRPFHADEIWTVNAILANRFASLIAFILGQDSHPPFYYLVCKVWSLLGFDSIPGVRLLSYGFSLTTLLVFTVFHLRYRVVSFLAPCLLVATNPLFTYYSTFVRPYALVVLLAALVILSALALRTQSASVQGQRKSVFAPGERTKLQVIFYASCLILGLTHYYGTLLVVILLFWDLFERRISSKRIIGSAIMLTLLTWPILQILFGSLNYQVQSNGWVKVVPFLSTLNNLLMGVFPLQLLSRQPHYIFSLAMLVALLVVSRGSAPRWQLSASLARLRSVSISTVEYLFIPILLIFLFSLIADQKTPFSTPYYFLVCLPAVAVLFGMFIHRIANRISPAVAFLLLGAVASAQWLLAVEMARQA